MGHPAPPPAWYPDPSGTPQLRWWDGRQWTQHTQPQQQQHPPQGYTPQQQSALNTFDPSFDGGSMNPDRVREQVARKGGPVMATGGGTLFTEPILVVNQRAKVFEASTEYAVFDQHGQQLGSVAQVGQSGAGKAIKMFTHYDALMPVRLEVRDRMGQAQIVVHKPVQMWKAKIQVTAANGAPIGEIGQDNVWGKIRFNYLVNGQRIGGMRAENLRGWDFSITDGNEQEIARINKVFAGFAKTMFTHADNYVVRIHAPLPGPLAPLVLGSALTVDTVLKQR